MNPLVWKSFPFSGNGMDLLDLFRDEPYVFFLDSSQDVEGMGRFSFIGFDPFEVFQEKGGNAFPLLKERFSRYRMPWSPAPVPFSGGMAGYLAYDLGLYLERIPQRIRREDFFSDCLFGFYDCILTLDHWEHKLYITSTGLPERNSTLRQKRARFRMEEILKKLSHETSSKKKVAGRTPQVNEQKLPGGLSQSLTSNFTKKEYLQAVQKALEYIRQGEIYQVNLSQRFSLDKGCLGLQIDPVDLYRALRQASPSSFGAFMGCGDFHILSSSPERFLRLTQGVVQTRPMKGTRPRGCRPTEDQHLKEALLKSPKEKAELLMITDLERNDLGRVCEYGSIQVKAMRTIETYQTVFQATSTVEGVLRKGKDAFDLLGACFPGGSVTGCPKIRAMQIIEELEPTPRGLYTGALGYVDFSGDMDFNILIRTLLCDRKQISFQVGGGIVADSDPQQEYEETLIKAQAILSCLQSAVNPTKRELKPPILRPSEMAVK